jgi:hypothetical protein
MKLLDKFIAAAVAVFIAGLAVVLVIVFLHERNQEYAKAAENQVTVARSTLAELDRYYEVRRGELAAFALNLDSASPAASTGSSARTMSQLTALRRLSPDWTAVEYLKPNQVVTPLYKEALGGKIVQSSVMKAADNRLIVTIAVPAYRDGAIAGVLTASLEWKTSLAVAPMSDNADAYLFNQQGVLLAGNRPESQKEILRSTYAKSPGLAELLAQKTGTLVIPNLGKGDQPMISSQVTLDRQAAHTGEDWALVISKPASGVSPSFYWLSLR